MVSVPNRFDRGPQRQRSRQRSQRRVRLFCVLEEAAHASLDAPSGNLPQLRRILRGSPWERQMTQKARLLRVFAKHAEWSHYHEQLALISFIIYCNITVYSIIHVSHVVPNWFHQLTKSKIMWSKGKSP